MKFPLRKMKVSAMYIKGTKAPLNRTFDQVWQSCVRRKANGYGANVHGSHAKPRLVYRYICEYNGTVDKKKHDSIYHRM